jgi:peptidoglycan biosynthesis protein MviN/MurJ (putative lipid II flippase)
VRAIGYFAGVSQSTPKTGRLAGNTLVTAVSQVVTMGLGAVLALVVLFVFGKTAATDGLFTAYGVYGIILMVAQSQRTTIVSRLVEAPSLWGAFNGYVGAVLALALFAAVPLVALGDPLAHVLTGAASGAAHDTARTALWLFALAGGAQLLAGLGAAALGALDRFVVVSVAYLAAGVTSIVGLALLAGPLDVTAVPVAVAVGSVLNAALMARGLFAAGWRPDGRLMTSATEIGRRAGTIVSGAALYAASQAIFVVSLALAARIGSGAATVYTYAFFAASFIVGVSSGSVGIVLAAPLAQTWERSPTSLTPHLRTIVRLGATLILPVLGVAAIAGDDLASAALGSKLTSGDARALAGSFVALAGFMLAMLAATVPLLAAFALSRYRAVAMVAIASVIAHVGLSLAAATTDRLEILAVAASASTVLMLVGLLAIVYGRHAGTPLLAVVTELVAPVGIAVATFGAAWGLTLVVPGRAADIALAAVGAGAYLVVVRALLPSHWVLVRRLLAPLAGVRRPAREASPSR